MPDIRLIGCFLDPRAVCTHMRCRRARDGEWACTGCGHHLDLDGVCDACDVRPGSPEAVWLDWVNDLARSGALSTGTTRVWIVE